MCVGCLCHCPLCVLDLEDPCRALRSVADAGAPPLSALLTRAILHCCVVVLLLFCARRCSCCSGRDCGISLGTALLTVGALRRLGGLQGRISVLIQTIANLSSESKSLSIGGAGPAAGREGGREGGRGRERREVGRCGAPRGATTLARSK